MDLANSPSKSMELITLIIQPESMKLVRSPAFYANFIEIDTGFGVLSFVDDKKVCVCDDIRHPGSLTVNRAGLILAINKKGFVLSWREIDPHVYIKLLWNEINKLRGDLEKTTTELKLSKEFETNTLEFIREKSLI